MSHTPGPWGIISGRSHNHYPYQIVASSGDIVTTWGAIARRASHEGQSNARLIAAAPEMLEALTAMREHAEHSTPQGAQAFLRAALAIAKATGGAK